MHLGFLGLLLCDGRLLCDGCPNRHENHDRYE